MKSCDVIAHNSYSQPASFDKGLVGRFLFGCLFVAAMSSPRHDVALHHLYRKFPIVRRPFLADQAIGTA